MNNNPPQKVVTRFAPSPTGHLHLGSARTALFDHLFAKKHGGTNLLRIEDTDKERSTKAFEENIFEGLAWLGLPFDGTPARQSERGPIYKKYLEKMIGEGTAYLSKEEPKEPGGRTEVIRFRNPNKRVVFSDLIRGEIEFDTTELKDFVIAKSPLEPLYHLAVVVDDMLMGVTHVIRGEDHISNTPRQILLQEALGAPRPIYGHLPLILAPDRSKLSKRKHGESVSLPYYKEKGYLPSAIINFLALLGWNPGTEQEIFTLEELVLQFDIAKVHKAGAVFNIEKLNWLNREHINRLQRAVPEKEIVTRPGEPQFTSIEKIAPFIVDRIVTLSDIDALKTSGEFSYLFEKPIYPIALLKNRSHLSETRERMGNIAPENWNAEELKNALWDFATEKGRGEVLWPLRVALSGKEKSIDPFTLAALLGKEEAHERLSYALSLKE